jgi:hypothetical protein
VRQRPARDHDVANALGAQVLRRERADVAGADDENAAPLQTSEDLARQGDGSKS